MKITQILIAAAALAGSSFAADQAAITIQLDPSQGFQARSWNFGVSSTYANGAMSTRAAFSDVTLVKQFDDYTTKLFAAAAAGTHFEKVTITQRDPATRQTIAEIVLTGVHVSNYQISGSTSALDPVETVTLRYDRITINYYGPAGRMSAGWDLAANKRI